MLPIAGSIFAARRLWLKAFARCESSSSPLSLSGLARRATHTESWSQTDGPEPPAPEERRKRRKRRILSESARQVLKAGLDNRDVTPEHVEAIRHLSTVFSETDPNKITLRPDGFVPVSRVLQHPLLANISFTTLEQIVRWDQKRRFQLIYQPMALSPCSENWWLRVRKGHSEADIRNLFLRPIQSPSQAPLAIYVTTPEVWEKTISRAGLPRENEPYIHLAKSIPGREPIFGKRPIVLRTPLQPESLIGRNLPEIRREHIAKVIIYVDVAKAMAAGVPFFSSKRKTIATPGNKYGVLEPNFFRRVDLVNIRMSRVIDELGRLPKRRQTEVYALQASGLSMSDHEKRLQEEQDRRKLQWETEVYDLQAPELSISDYERKLEEEKDRQKLHWEMTSKAWADTLNSEPPTATEEPTKGDGEP